MSGGVFIGDGHCSIRLTRDGERGEIGYPVFVEVKAGSFRGAIDDNVYSFVEFRKQLASLYETLEGEAAVQGLERVSIVLSGTGKGGIEVRVRIVDEYQPLIELNFTFLIDQSYLPSVLQQIDAEFD